MSVHELVHVLHDVREGLLIAFNVPDVLRDLLGENLQVRCGLNVVAQLVALDADLVVLDERLLPLGLYCDDILVAFSFWMLQYPTK
jgi:hypothetical protein